MQSLEEVYVTQLLNERGNLTCEYQLEESVCKYLAAVSIRNLRESLDSWGASSGLPYT